MNTHPLTELRRDPLIDTLCRYAETRPPAIDHDAHELRIETAKALRASNRIYYAPLLLIVPYVLGPVLGVVDQHMENVLVAAGITAVIALGAWTITSLQSLCLRVMPQSSMKPVDPSLHERLAGARKAAANRPDLLAVLDHAEASHGVTADLLETVVAVAELSGMRRHA